MVTTRVRLCSLTGNSEVNNQLLRNHNTARLQTVTDTRADDLTFHYFFFVVILFSIHYKIIDRGIL